MFAVAPLWLLQGFQVVTLVGLRLQAPNLTKVPVSTHLMVQRRIPTLLFNNHFPKRRKYLVTNPFFLASVARRRHSGKPTPLQFYLSLNLKQRQDELPPTLQ
jgi:hypothetical protein